MDRVKYVKIVDYISALRKGEAPTGKDLRFNIAGATRTDGETDTHNSALQGEGVAGATGDAAESYTVRVFNGGIARLLKSDYSPGDIERLSLATAELRHIGVVRKPWGAFISAASFESDETAESTNYDAIWVRDSIWGYLALASDPDRQDDAKAVLLTQLDYMASQSERIDRAIESPELLGLPGAEGDRNAVHIRFDCGSKDFTDVMSDGRPQEWTHKQNDAIGLLIGATVDAYANRLIAMDDMLQEGVAVGHSRLAALVRLVAYLAAVKFYIMEDSGAWEEQPRRNTSSIGIVISSLEKLRDELARDIAFAEGYAEAARCLGLKDRTCEKELGHLIAGSYSTVRLQLLFGGESPDYAKDDPRYREADAALLSLIYPASPRQVSTKDKLAILDKVSSLAGPYGIRRYERDNYQSGNFWWHDIRTDADPESHRKREESFIPGTEAEWFFDSWYAKCCLIVAKEIGEGAQDGLAASLRAKAVKSLNRAFGQITGDGMCSADGKPVPPMEPPESYNHIIALPETPETQSHTAANEPESWPAPSPITPLNWAKASLTLMLDEFER